MSKCKCVRNWKTISVVDESKKEIFKLEVGEKIEARPSKNVSTLYKKIMLIRDKQLKYISNFLMPIMKSENNPINSSHKFVQPPPKQPKKKIKKERE